MSTMMSSKPYTKNETNKNRINNQIKYPYILLIGNDGESLGRTSTSEAIRIANDSGLDLVEVAFNSKDNLPICKLLDYGKLKYEKAKNQSKSKKNNNQMKEIKISFSIAEHDLNIKIDHIKKFLEKGLKVKYTLQLKGRQKHNAKIAFELFTNSLNKLVNYADWNEPRINDNIISVILSPKKS